MRNLHGTQEAVGISVILVCFALEPISTGRKVTEAWLEKHELPWQSGKPVSTELLVHELEKKPKEPGVRFAVWKWSVIQKALGVRVEDTGPIGLGLRYPGDSGRD